MMRTMVPKMAMTVKTTPADHSRSSTGFKDPEEE